MEQRYPNVREYFGSQLWAIRQEALSIMAEVIQLRANGISFTTEEIQARINAGQQRSSVATSGQLAVLPLYGVIDQKVSAMQQVSGGTSVDEFMDAFRAAIADDSVSAILFDVDSPGGSVCGVPEAATEIYNARGKKLIVAVANPMIASAAYWLASAAHELYCMPSGSVGSIGVIAMHEDCSVMNETMGYKPTYITYGQYKAEGNSDNPLSPDALAYRQSQVDTMGNMFTAFIARARNIPVATVRADFGQGRMMLAKDAQSIGMIDGIATREQVIANISKGQLNKTKALNAEVIETEIVNEDFSNMKVREATTQVLVGLDATLDSWDGLVVHQIAGGKQLGELLSKGKTESILALKDGLSKASERMDGILASAGIGVEPIVAEQLEAAVEPETATQPQQSTAFELERSRLELRMRLTQQSK